MTDYTISVSGLTAGAQGVNTLSADFTNPACTVVANTTWTPLSTKYLAATDNTDYVVRSVSGHATRDMEVTTWVRSGYVFLRLDGTGKAIYFFHDGSTTNGTLDIGITTSLTESAYPSGTQYVLYRNANLVGTVSGYDRTDTTGDAFTFGVSGFDIYVEFNGVEFCRFKEYRHMASGDVAIKTNVAGFRDITHTTLATASLFSNYASNEIDMRDWWMRSLATTGTISASSTSLAVADATGFLVGDYVIVETGNEDDASAGTRGTVGVGGSWPTLNYANLATLLATNPATGTFSWQRFTGEIWRYANEDVTISNASPGVITLAANYFTVNARVTFRAGSGTLPSQIVAGTVYYVVSANYTGTTLSVSATQGGTAINTSGGSGTVKLNWIKTQPYDTVNYYLDKALARSLQARITNIAGNTITLDTPATVSATSATVHLDNQIFLNDLLQIPRDNPSNLAALMPASLTIVIPPGHYVVGGRVHTQEFTGWTVKGLGQTVSFIDSAKGMCSANFLFYQMEGLTVKDFTVSGNLQNLDRFGTTYFTTIEPLVNNSQYDAAGRYITGMTTGGVNDTTLNEDWNTPSTRFQSCTDVVMQDCTGNHQFCSVVSFEASLRCWAYRCTANVGYNQQSYSQWQIIATDIAGASVDDSGGGFVDCVVNHQHVAAAFAQYRSTGIQFTRCIGNNGIFDTNNCGDWVYQDCAVNVTLNGAGSNTVVSQALVQLTGNSGTNFISAGTINNMVIACDYVNASNDIIPGIIVDAVVHDVTIRGGSYSSPPYAAPASATFGCVGIISIGTNTVVDGFRCCGTIAPGGITFLRANISVMDGIIINCIADNFFFGPGATGSPNYSCSDIIPGVPILLGQACM